MLSHRALSIDVDVDVDVVPNKQNSYTTHFFSSTDFYEFLFVTVSGEFVDFFFFWEEEAFKKLNISFLFKILKAGSGKKLLIKSLVKAERANYTKI